MRRYLTLSLALLAACSAPERTPPEPEPELPSTTTPPRADAGRTPDARVSPTPDAAVSPDASAVSSDVALNATDAATTGGRDAVANGDAATTSPGRPFVFTVSTGGQVRSYAFENRTGALNMTGNAANAGFTTWGVVHPRGTHFYTSSADGNVHAFAIESGASLRFLGKKAFQGDGTHVDIDRTGRHLFVAGYGTGTLATVALEGGGAQFGATRVLTPGSRAHQVRVHPSNRFVYVPCLGANHVAQYAFDAATGTLTPMTPATVTAAGGPRHMDFSPDGRLAYVLSEGSGQVHVFSIEANGALRPLQSVAGQGGSSSDIHVSPDGKFVYAVFRAANQIGLYAADGDGKLTFVEKQATGGDHSRSFAIEPTGRFLLIAHGNGGGLVRFSINPASGKLTRLADPLMMNGLWFVGFTALP